MLTEHIFTGVVDLYDMSKDLQEIFDKTEDRAVWVRTEAAAELIALIGGHTRQTAPICSKTASNFSAAHQTQQTIRIKFLTWLSRYEKIVREKRRISMTTKTAVKKTEVKKPPVDTKVDA